MKNCISVDLIVVQSPHYYLANTETIKISPIIEVAVVIIQYAVPRQEEDQNVSMHSDLIDSSTHLPSALNVIEIFYCNFSITKAADTRKNHPRKAAIHTYV